MGIELITTFNRRPKFTSFCETSLSKIQDGMLDIASFFNVENAIGKQLDIIGEYVGLKRELNFQPTTASPVLDDDDYRTLIRASIIKNTWKGTIGEIYELWEEILPGLYLIIKDNQDMTMDMIVGGANDLIKELIENGYFAPKPMGVKINYTFLPAGDEIFGYDTNTNFIRGYDEGVWIL